MSQRLDRSKAKQQLRALFIKGHTRWSNKELFDEQVMELYDALHTPTIPRTKRKLPKYY